MSEWTMTDLHMTPNEQFLACSTLSPVIAWTDMSSPDKEPVLLDVRKDEMTSFAVRKEMAFHLDLEHGHEQQWQRNSLWHVVS